MYFEPPMRMSCRLSRSEASGSSTSAKWLVSSRVNANATTNGKRAMRFSSAAVSQKEMAGLVR